MSNPMTASAVKGLQFLLRADTIGYYLCSQFRDLWLGALYLSSLMSEDVPCQDKDPMLYEQ